MARKIDYLLSLMCLTVFLPIQGKAADSTPWSFKLSPGYSIPDDASSDSLNGAFSIAGTLDYQIQEWVAVGLEAGYASHKLEGVSADTDVDGDGLADRLDVTSDIHAKILHVTPEVKIGHFVNCGNFQVRPYVLFGVGYYHLSSNSGTLGLSGTTSRGILLNSFPVAAPGMSDTYAGAQAGVGLDGPINKHLNTGFSVQFHQIFEPGRDDKFVIPSFYLAYLF